MKTFKVTLVFFALIAFGSFAWADSWVISSDASLTLTQNAYSDNWEGEEAGSISWTFNSNTQAKKEIYPWLKSRSILKLEYGQTASQNVETKDWSAPQKSADLIDFETIFRFPINWYVDPYASLGLKSQFDDGSNENSGFFDPVVYQESAGIIKAFLDDENRDLTTRLGFAFKQGVDREVLQPNGIDRRTEYFREGGFEWVTDALLPIPKSNVVYKGKLTLFKAVYSSYEDEFQSMPKGDYWQEIDITWENTFSASIMKYVMVKLDINLLYDKEIDKAGRLKETLSLGLTYILI